MTRNALFLAVSLLLGGCNPHSELKAEVDDLRAQVGALELQLDAQRRELQTFEDMTTACQKDNPDWRFIPDNTP